MRLAECAGLVGKRVSSGSDSPEVVSFAGAGPAGKCVGDAPGHAGRSVWRESPGAAEREQGGGTMVKLTAELIEQAAQYTNAVRDRELDLRGESGESPEGGLRQGRPGPSPAGGAEGPSRGLRARPGRGTGVGSPPEPHPWARSSV